jgi:hypothetical protein
MQFQTIPGVETPGYFRLRLWRERPAKSADAFRVQPAVLAPVAAGQWLKTFLDIPKWSEQSQIRETG